MIVCIEGPSAVGKTTTSRAVVEQFGAFCIAEANALFPRPKVEAPDWYLERQVDRWKMAWDSQADHQLVILDGDPFQPFWYNWAYNFTDYQPLDDLCAFYRPRLASGEIGFPDRYVYLLANATELRRRKDADKARRRSGFETHLRLIETQPRYFMALSQLAPGMVHMVEAKSVDGNVRKVIECTKSTVAKETDSLWLFDNVVEWLRMHSA